MLPAGVFTHRTERSQQYINYPVFSWPWFWRRACFFGPFGFIFGAVMAAPIPLVAGDWQLVLGAVLRLAPAWSFMMVFGTALGMWVRHRNFAPALERNLLILAVLVGIAASYGAKFWYEDYMDKVIGPIAKSVGALNLIPSLATARGYKIFYEILLAWIIVSVSGGRALYNYFTELRRWRLHGANQEIQVVKQQRDDADRKLTVLQAQVEPHFLYNTLASVRSLISTEPRRAEATIDALVDHLRATLPKIRDESGNTRSTLADQIEICKSYLEVMKVRMGERFSYTIDVPSQLAQELFPSLMLLSLVENAIKHGIEPKPGRCSVQIVARRIEDPGVATLEVAVVDDGVGLREGPSDGVGLANIRAQLTTRYGQRAAVRLEGRDAGGTRASIRVPIETAV
jgi:two-component sensor histidine kinase